MSSLLLLRLPFFLFSKPNVSPSWWILYNEKCAAYRAPENIKMARKNLFNQRKAKEPELSLNESCRKDDKDFVLKEKKPQYLLIAFAYLSSCYLFYALTMVGQGRKSPWVTGRDGGGGGGWLGGKDPWEPSCHLPPSTRGMCLRPPSWQQADIERGTAMKYITTLLTIV